MECCTGNCGNSESSAEEGNYVGNTSDCGAEWAYPNVSMEMRVAVNS